MDEGTFVQMEEESFVPLYKSHTCVVHYTREARKHPTIYQKAGDVQKSASGEYSRLRSAK